MTAITKNYTLADVIRSQEAVRRGIDNTPPVEFMGRIMRTAENIVEPLRAQFPRLVVSSWYRSPELCVAIGSKPTSQHATGEAVDFEVPGVANIDLAYWCKDNLPFDQLILEFYKPSDPAAGWVHCSFVDWREPRRSVLTIGSGKTEQGLPTRGEK